MSEATWATVDRYINEHLLAGTDPMFESVLKANAAAGLPSIDVSPTEGKFLHLLVRLMGAHRILEIGTLGGYSTLWMATALPAEGRLISLEFNAKHAEVARANIERAGRSPQVEIRTGAALDLLPTLMGPGVLPFDLTFIDADKSNNPNYLDWAAKLTRKGGCVILDNVVREGKVVDAKSSDPSIKGSRAAFELLRNHPKLDATALQTVGLKGYDGFALAIVK